MALDARLTRAELPNGVYFHNILFREWDDDLVMRSPAGRLVVPADVVRAKHSDTHVFVARRDRGRRDAHEFYVYDVAADRLDRCRRSDEGPVPSCASMLEGTGIRDEDTDEPHTIGGWRDWRYLSGSEAGLSREWREPGSGGGLSRSLRDSLGY